MIATQPPTAGRNWSLLASAQALDAPSWVGSLPLASAAELELARLDRLAEAALATLPAPVLAAAEVALSEVWRLGEARSSTLELVLSKAGHRGRQRLDLPLGEMPVRIGSGPSCHVRISDLGLAREQCELKLEKGEVYLVDVAEGSTRLGSQALRARSPRKIAAGDVIEAGELRVEVGRLRGPDRQGSARLRVMAAKALASREPFTALGGRGEIWLPFAAGGLRGYLRVPESWLSFAYASLGWSPPAAVVGLANPVDRAITTFARGRVAAALAAEGGLAVETGQPLERPEDSGELWFFAALEVAFGERRLPATVLWSAASRLRQAPEPGLRSPLGRLRFDARVRYGESRLSTLELASVGPGDVLVPERWLGRSAREAAAAPFAGEATLAVQHLERPVAVSLDHDRLELSLASSHWTALPQGGMPNVPEIKETQNAPALPTGLPRELEVAVSFELDRLSVPFAELASWQEGTAIRLERSPEEPVRILVHDAAGSRVMGHGRVLVIDGRVGIAVEQWWDATEADG